MLTATDPTVHGFIVETPSVEVRGIVQRVLWNLQTSHSCVERRRAQRHAYPYPLRLWLANACCMSIDGSIEAVGEGTVVMGKHLATGGLDFYTPQPIADRKVVVSFDSEGDSPIQVLVELTWCRFGGYGMYLNGGRFLRALSAKPHVPRQRVEP
ncbi:MAG: hypothetical protein QGG71_03065 [Pirellulaceae bacterium]|jgi:hypothetical protein|nr:hypothetical protein [Pirellulaceae bacterium]